MLSGADGQLEWRPAPGGATATRPRWLAFVTSVTAGDRQNPCSSWVRLAHIRGRYEQALQALDEAAELARHLGNTEQTIKLLSIAGNILVLAGDYPAALTRHEEALRLAQRLNLQSEIAFIRNGMGLSARRQGDYPLARAHHEHAMAVYRRGAHAARRRADPCLARLHGRTGG